MTAIKGIKTVKSGGSRMYVHPVTGEHAASVTSVIGAATDRSFLKFWAAKLTAETSYDDFGTLAGFVVKGERDAAINWLKSAHTRATSGAAVKGTEVHEMIEQCVEQGGLPRGLRRDLVPYARGFAEFLEVTQAEVAEVETTVWSTSKKYSGTFDMAVRLPESCWDGAPPEWYNGPDELFMCDVKTTRSGVHAADVALQMSAYAHAEQRLIADESGKPLIEPNHRYNDVGLVIWLRPDQWALHPVSIGADVFKVFSSMVPIFDWSKNLSKEVGHQPLVHRHFIEPELVTLDKLLDAVGERDA